MSVVVPTRDRPGLVAAAVASILAQDHQDLECLVVDDGSAAPPMSFEDPRVRVLRRDTPGGPGAARNTGIDAARGRWIAFLDDDDVWLPGRLSRALAMTADADVVVCWSGDLGAPNDRPGRDLHGNVFDEILSATTPSVGATLVRADLIPRFDEGLPSCEDLDWWLRLARGARVATAPHADLRVRRHDAPRSAHGAEARRRDSERLLAIHRSYFDSHPRAAAFRWKRIGVLSLELADPLSARRAFARSLLRWPHPGTAVRLVRALFARRLS